MGFIWDLIQEGEIQQTLNRTDDLQQRILMLEDQLNRLKAVVEEIYHWLPADRKELLQTAWRQGSHHD